MTPTSTSRATALTPRMRKVAFLGLVSFRARSWIGAGAAMVHGSYTIAAGFTPSPTTRGMLRGPSMDFSESPRVATVRATVRQFVEKELLPLEPQLARQGFVALLPTLKEKRERARQTGLWAAHLPEKHGGAGLSLTEFAHMSEELGKTPIGHYAFNCQAPDVGNMEILIENGTDEQKEKFLKPLVRGEARSCFTMTEPEFAGSNPVW